jgi:hypothetical protein
MSGGRDSQPTDDEFWRELVGLAFAKEAREFPKKASARREQSKTRDGDAESLADVWKESKSVADAWKDNLALALLRTAERALARLKPAGPAPARIRLGHPLTSEDHEALTGDLITIIGLAKAFVVLRDARSKRRRAGSRKDGRPAGKWLRWQSPEHWTAFMIRTQYEAWRRKHRKGKVPHEEKEEIDNKVIGDMERVQGKRLNKERIRTLVRGPIGRIL